MEETDGFHFEVNHLPARPFLPANLYSHFGLYLRDRARKAQVRLQHADQESRSGPPRLKARPRSGVAHVCRGGFRRLRPAVAHDGRIVLTTHFSRFVSCHRLADGPDQRSSKRPSRVLSWPSVLRWSRFSRFDVGAPRASPRLRRSGPRNRVMVPENPRRNLVEEASGPAAPLTAYSEIDAVPHQRPVCHRRPFQGRYGLTRLVDSP